MVRLKLKKSKGLQPLVAVLVTAAAVISYVISNYTHHSDITIVNPEPAVSASVSNSQFYIVQRAVDGDTLALSNGEKVRLIGVDTPESASNPKLYRDVKKTGKDAQTILAMGAQAKAYTKKLCEGQRVRLVTDVTPRDKYGRLLAYVYKEDNTFVNAELIRSGYAQVYTIPPNVKYAKFFRQLETEARENRRGLWR